MNLTKKRCSRCARLRGTIQFHRAGAVLRSHCRDCRAAHAANPDRRWRNQVLRIARTYGVPFEEAWELLNQAVAGPCDGCGLDASREDQAGHVDHDHETGKVRGVLCRECNLILGLALDDPGTLRALANYLELRRSVPWSGSYATSGL